MLVPLLLVFALVQTPEATSLSGKPLVAVIAPDSTPSGHLLRVADVVVKADIDTEEGRQTVAHALQVLPEMLGE